MKTAFRCGPNRSSYRGRSYRLLSGALGLCLTGVKRGPTVRCMTYRYVNVGSAMIGLLKTELAAAEVIIAWRSTHSSLSQRKSGTWRRGAVTMEAGKEGRAKMYARYDRTKPCAPLLSLSKRRTTIVMESCVMRKDHAQFGERERETRLSRGRKVRSVPTPLTPPTMLQTLCIFIRR